MCVSENFNVFKIRKSFYVKPNKPRISIIYIFFQFIFVERLPAVHFYKSCFRIECRNEQWQKRFFPSSLIYLFIYVFFFLRGDDDVVS